MKPKVFVCEGNRNILIEHNPRIFYIDSEETFKIVLEIIKELDHEVSNL